jgi:predicted amidophosphoribosyltransferase
VLTTSLVDLIFPSRCAVCDRPGKNLCLDCKNLLWIEPRDFLISGLAVYTVTKYSDATSKLLVSLNDKGQFALVAELAQMLKPVIQTLPTSESIRYLVPAPSSSENFSRRSFHPMLLLAQAVASKHPSLSVLNCLRFARPVKDQVGLTESERIVNLSSSMELNQSVPGRVCYLLDDVVTTGVTALEAARVLRFGGATLAGVLAISYSKG